MRYKTREELLSENYRKVEAMYRKKLSTDEIVSQTGLDRFGVLDIEQKIFALDQVRKVR